MASIAVCAILAGPAMATDNDSVKTPVCVEDTCYPVMAEPFLMFETSADAPASVHDRVVIESASRDWPYVRPSTLTANSPMPDTVTVIGKIEHDDRMIADDHLTTDGSLITTNDEIEPAGAFAGVGLKSTF